MREPYGHNTFGGCCLLARHLIEARTRFVEINWPKVANSDNNSWECHTALSRRTRNQAAPIFHQGLCAPIADLDRLGYWARCWSVPRGARLSPQRGLSTSGNSNTHDSRDHCPYYYTAHMAGAGVRCGFVYGRANGTASTPLENAVHPTDLLATSYYSLGIDPSTIMYNHLNQLRELLPLDVLHSILASGGSAAERKNG